jgi:hydrophobic/amphiphilic exporter-1 (mainly G- bacteria), HAE1 family
MNLTRLAIARPVFILMLMLAAVLLGTMAYRSMRVELQPDVNFGVVTVTTVYPGAGPEEISNLISKKIEDAVSSVSGVQEITSTSREGLSLVMVQLEIGVDADVALNEVRSKVDGAVPLLPRDVERPTVSKFDTGSQPILYLSFNAERLSNRDLRDLIDNRLADRFGRIKGVAGASAVGGDVPEIQVQVDRDRLFALGIGILDVQRAVQAATLNVPSGNILTEDRRFSVRVQGEFQTVDEIRDMVFSVRDSSGGPGTVVRLADVATVVDGVREWTSYATLNGLGTVALTIQKTREGNAVEITREAQQVIKQIEAEFEDVGLSVVIAQQQARQIEESLHDMSFALFFGIFLVALIVHLFLHDFRGTLIVAIAIPTCIFITFIALALMGFTINNMSLLALALAVGVLVDDAIVVIENIYRHLRMGEEPRDAAINGRAEIGLAAIAITLADVVVFLPIAFMGGIVGQFFKPLAVGYVVAVLTSLFVSFTVTPMLAARWYRKGEDVEHVTGGFALRFENGFQRFAAWYGRALQWSLRHRWFVFISGNLALIAIILFIVGLVALPVAMIFLGIATFIGLIVYIANIFRGFNKPRLIAYGALFGLIFPAAALTGGLYRAWKDEAVFKFQFLPASDGGRISVNVELPPGANLAATGGVVEEVTRRIQDHPDIQYVLSTVGSSGSGMFSGGDSGQNISQISVSLYERRALSDRMMFWNRSEQLRVKSSDAVAADLLQRIGKIPGAEITVSAADGIGFGSPIQLALVSDDRPTLLEAAETIKRRLQQGEIAGIINPDTSSNPGTPEIVAVPNRPRLADAGITTADLASAMRTLYEGNVDAKYRIQGREYDIRVRMAVDDRNDPEAVRQVPISFSQGTAITLAQIADVQPGTTVSKIERRDRREEVRLNADLLPGYAAGTVQQELNRWLTQENLLPSGVEMLPLGQAQAQQREMGYLMTALFLGFILVYMLLASLYNNLLYPFIIQLAQPQAMVGALLALVLTDKSLNLVGFIGLIALVGLVGKNAILLVDYTNTLRSRGRPRHDALVEAGPVRLRPIMMTTLALVFAMIPVALAFGRGSEFRETIGIVIIGGMTLSTVLTLLVIPCSYTIFDDLSESLSRFMRRRRGRPDPEASNLEEGEPDRDRVSV